MVSFHTHTTQAFVDAHLSTDAHSSTYFRANYNYIDDILNAHRRMRYYFAP